MVLFTVKPPLAVAAVIVGAFAIFHGHAHGAELPASANPLAFSLGFVLSTGTLHLIGIGFGQIMRRPGGLIAVRAAGAVIAVIGGAFLTGYA
jgi:urease accessory protein